jgi:type I restriction enzyme, S subunit
MTSLPPGWAESTLGEIGEYLNGRGFKKSEWRESGRPIIRIQNLTGSGEHFNYFDDVPEERYTARAGDLLVSWAATLGVFVWKGPEAVINQHIFKVRSHIDRDFHRYLLLSVLGELRRQTHGSGMVHITKARFEQTPVSIPPLAEQPRIVAAIEERFSRLDAAIELLTNACRRLGRLRDAGIDRAFAGDWSWTSTGDVAEVQGGIQKQPKRRPVRNRAPFLRVANVLRGRLDLEEVHEIEIFNGELERYRLLPGDLLVVEGNGSVDQIGRSAMWRDEIANCVHQNHLIRVRPGPELLPAFLDAYWNSLATRRRLAEVASSTSGLYTLSTAKVKAVPIPIVPLEEQHFIVEQLERQLSIIDATTVEVDSARRRGDALRRSILQRAFAGQLVEHDPSNEPASLLLGRIGIERAARPRASRRRSKVPA